MKRFSYDDLELKENYIQQGFVIVEDLDMGTDLKDLNKRISQLFALRPNGKREIGTTQDDSTRGHAPGSPMLHKEVQDVYHQDRDFYNQCWDAIRLTPELVGLTNNAKLVHMLHNIGMKQPLLEIYPAIRIDLPNESGRILPWHQEWPYGLGSLNSLTVWIAMMDIGKEQGALRVIPGSHKLGLFPTISSDNIFNWVIPEGILDESSAITIEVKEGEALVISSFLLHASGRNVSDQCRYSLQIRYNDAYCPYFRTNGWIRSFKIEGTAKVPIMTPDKKISFKSYE